MTTNDDGVMANRSKSASHFARSSMLFRAGDKLRFRVAGVLAEQPKNGDLTKPVGRWLTAAGWTVIPISCARTTHECRAAGIGSQGQWGGRERRGCAACR